MDTGETRPPMSPLGARLFAMGREMNRGIAGASARAESTLREAQEDLRRNRAVPVKALDETERAFELARRRAAIACAEAAQTVLRVLALYADELEHDQELSRLLGPFPAACAEVEKGLWRLP